MRSFPSGAVAVVQGATRGLGAAFVARLLESGRFHHVYATGRQPATSDALAALMSRHGDSLTTLAADVTREEDIAALAGRVGREHARVHLLINVSGVLHDEQIGMSPEKRLEDVNQVHMEYGFRVNAFAPVLMARHFVDLLNHPERAVLANLSARVGSIGDNRLGGWYTYRASKAAQNMFTRTLAIEFSRRARNIICVALHPGTTDTALSRPYQSRVPEGGLFSSQFAAARLLGIIDGLNERDSGRFFAWDGQEIPW